MDSLTQIVLGAAVGELVLGKKVGNKAMLWGGIAGTIPDLDVLSGFFLDDLTKNEVHRGFTHSIAFCILAAPLFARWVKRSEKTFMAFFLFLCAAVFLFSDQVGTAFKIGTGLVYLAAVIPILLLVNRKIEANVWDWTKMFWWCLFTHPILDCHTSWGTQILWPLPIKFAWNNIFVVDLFYTVPFLLCLLIARFLKRGSLIRVKFNKLGILLSSTYLVFTLIAKYKVHKAVEASLKRQDIRYHSISTRPTPLNAILWAANVNSDDSYHLAYHSLLDTKPEVDFVAIPKEHHLLGDLDGHEKVERLKRLSEHEYVIRSKGDTLIFNDLRFGQFGDISPESDFVFAYTLYKVGEELVVEEIPPPRPNGNEMNEEMSKLFERMKGE